MNIQSFSIFLCVLFLAIFHEFLIQLNCCRVFQSIKELNRLIGTPNKLANKDKLTNEVCILQKNKLHNQ